MSYSNCPKCGSSRVTRLSSMRMFYCHSGCGKLPWDLKPGQQPLVSSNRSKAVAKTHQD